jgi:hypothetical protein
MRLQQNTLTNKFKVFSGEIIQNLLCNGHLSLKKRYLLGAKK